MSFIFEMIELVRSVWPDGERRVLVFSTNVAIALMACIGVNSAQSADVLASRYNDQRTGAILDESILTTRNVNPEQFGCLFEYDTKADVYAQPLFVSNLTVPGLGRRNVVFVANVDNDIFAFDGDGRLPGENGLIWSRHLGTPTAINNAIGNDGDGNIREGGNVGIMSTPVIDRDSGTLFLVARIRRPNPDRQSRFDDSFVYKHMLHALDIATGEDKRGSPIEITASSGPHNFNPKIQNQRVGLAISRRQIIIGWGSHQDEKDYLGWVMSYRYDRNKFVQTGVFVTTAAGVSWAPRISYFCISPVEICAQGGVWQGGRAPAVDSQGRILLFVGNGHNNTPFPDQAVKSFGNSFVILDPVTLAVRDFFTPKNFEFLNFFDLDFGGSGPMIIPNSRFESVVGGGKEGIMYVLNLRGSDLGGFSPTDAGVAQKFRTGTVEAKQLDKNIPKNILIPDIPLPDGGSIKTLDIPTHVMRAGHIMGGPVFWNGTDGSFLYNWSEDSQLRRYKVDPTSITPVTTTEDSRSAEFLDGHPGGILALSANGSRAGTGIVWAATYAANGDTEGTLHSRKPGILRAYNAQIVEELSSSYDKPTLVELWSSDDNPRRDRLGTFAKFNPPTVVNGRVYIATFDSKLKVYGLLNHRYLRPDEVTQRSNAIQWWETLAPVARP